MNAVIRSLAIEYAKEGIRFNVVAPGVVDSPMHKDDPKESLKKFPPMGKIVEIQRRCRRCPFPGTSRSSNPERHSTWMVALTLAVGSGLG